MIFALAGLPHMDAASDVALIQRYNTLLAETRAEYDARVRAGYGCPGIVPPEQAAAFRLKQELGLSGLGNEPENRPTVVNPFTSPGVLALGALATIAIVWWWKGQQHGLRTSRLRFPRPHGRPRGSRDSHVEYQPGHHGPRLRQRRLAS